MAGADTAKDKKDKEQSQSAALDALASPSRGAGAGAGAGGGGADAERWRLHPFEKRSLISVLVLAGLQMFIALCVLAAVVYAIRFEKVAEIGDWLMIALILIAGVLLLVNINGVVGAVRVSRWPLLVYAIWLGIYILGLALIGAYIFRTPSEDFIKFAWPRVGNKMRISAQDHWHCCGLSSLTDHVPAGTCSYAQACLSVLDSELKQPVFRFALGCYGLLAIMLANVVLSVVLYRASKTYRPLRTDYFVV